MAKILWEANKFWYKCLGCGNVLEEEQKEKHECKKGGVKG